MNNRDKARSLLESATVEERTPTFCQLEDKYNPGQRHVAHLVKHCVECGDVHQCRCITATPKTVVDGICFDCCTRLNIEPKTGLPVVIVTPWTKLDYEANTVHPGDPVTMPDVRGVRRVDTVDELFLATAREPESVRRIAKLTGCDV